jgi:hypothetical protein
MKNSRENLRREVASPTGWHAPELQYDPESSGCSAIRSQQATILSETGLTIPCDLKPSLTANYYPHKSNSGEMLTMQVLNALADGTSVFGLSVYCATMTFFLGALAWANHLDARSEIEDQA